MNLIQWAIKWNIPLKAVQDLELQLGIINLNPLKEKKGESESAIQTRVRLEACRKGNILWRNNNGEDPKTHVRYGLANDSKKINNKIKSSDLIGIQRLLITEKMIGLVIGQFLACEIKQENWIYTGTPEEKAQLKFLEIVLLLGGDARFINSEGTL